MTVKTLTYATRNGAEMLGDLYLPEGGERCAALVGVPGGGWLRGSREQFALWGRYLAANGIAVFAIDYRRSEVGPGYPGNVEDVRDAWLYLRDNAETLGVDPARIGFLGASAGAHLAALAALTTDAAPQTLVLAYGVYDLVAHWQADRPRYTGPGSDLTERMLGATPEDDPDLYRAASPQFRITAERAKRIEAMLVWGTADDVVLPVQSEGFVKALKQAGATVLARPVEDAEHFWFSRDPLDDPEGHTHALAPEVLAFVRKAFAV